MFFIFEIDKFRKIYRFMEIEKYDSWNSLILVLLQDLKSILNKTEKGK